MTDLKHKILAMAKDDLEAIEEALLLNLKPHLDLVAQVAGHLLFSGGKRLRPLLMILSARICGYKMHDDKKLSTVFEYLHTASLLHDDIVDGASIRRGRPVAHSIWGNPTVVLVGDFLLARSLSIAAETGFINAIKIIAKITENMSQGEIQQLMKKGDFDFSEKEYMEVIRRKTSVLIQGACSVGALIANAPKKKETALSEYGLNLGYAFQMADDLLDYTSDTDVLGKEVGADLKEGKLTLPVIFALNNADSKDRSFMEKVIKNKDFSVHNFKALVELLVKYGGIQYTKKMAVKYVDRAKEAIYLFKNSETKELLLDVADYVLVRRF
ncbi:MAG TPA: polyprenyl synthetase family protein [Desulfobacteraceae bacterium]|nr:polyprenyl synthetase family protein [Desulfobacteraceae bacterium]